MIIHGGQMMDNGRWGDRSKTEGTGPWFCNSLFLRYLLFKSSSLGEALVFFGSEHRFEVLVFEYCLGFRISRFEFLCEVGPVPDLVHNRRKQREQRCDSVVLCYLCYLLFKSSAISTEAKQVSLFEQSHLLIVGKDTPRSVVRFHPMWSYRSRGISSH